MIKVKFTQDGSISVSLDPDWFPFLAGKFGRRLADPALNYSTSHVQSAYPDEASNLLRVRDGNRELVAPYITLVDYRDHSMSGLGRYVKSERYTLPGELALLKEAEVKRRESTSKLKKRDQPVIRMLDIEVRADHQIEMKLQEATYYDQVGSNLSVDAPLPATLGIDLAKSPTAREWDKLQAGGAPKRLPPLAASRLANTIGVAIGIRTQDDHGRPAIVVRKRGPDVDVYPNMWHLPFSFALSYTPPLPETGTIENLINFDYAHELNQETGLEPSEVKYIRALMLCRDLVRAGKPQFFLEMETTLGFDELNRRMRKHNSDEYRGSSRLMQIGKTPKFVNDEGSPELFAYICLCSQ